MAEILTYNGKQIGVALYAPKGTVMPCPVTGGDCLLHPSTDCCAFCGMGSFEITRGHGVPPMARAPRHHLYHHLAPNSYRSVAAVKAASTASAALVPLPPPPPFPAISVTTPVPPPAPAPTGASTVRPDPLVKRGRFLRSKRMPVAVPPPPPPPDPLDCDGIAAWRAAAANMATQRQLMSLEAQRALWHLLTPEQRAQVLASYNAVLPPPLPPAEGPVKHFIKVLLGRA